MRARPDGKFIWPGYGDNMRVLEWVVGRIEGKAQGADNAFGISPRYEDLNWNGLNFSKDQFARIIGMDHADWQQELKLHEELFAKLAFHLPAELGATKQRIAEKLAA